MKKILLTGGAGFIGSHTAEELCRLGHSVRILDSLDPQIHGEDAEWPLHLPSDCEKIKGSILNPTVLKDALQGIDTIYHFAAHTGVGQSMYEISHYAQTNIMGTALLVETLLKNKCSLDQIILASSRAVYGEGTRMCLNHGPFHPDVRTHSSFVKSQFAPICPICRETTISTIPINEFSNPQPQSYYALTKWVQEQILQQAFVHFQFPATILRYFNVYGAGQSLSNPYTGIISIFFTQMMNQQTIKLYENGEPIRDFVNVKDVVQANVKALDTQQISDGPEVILRNQKNFLTSKVPTFNVGSGQGHSLIQLMDLLKSKIKAAVDVQLTSLYRVGDIYSCVADLTLSSQILKYQPQINLEQGLEEFIEWAQRKLMENEKGRTSFHAQKELEKWNLLKKIS